MRDDSEDALGFFGDALGLFRGDLASSWSALAASSEGCLRRALEVLWGTLGIVWGCSRGCLEVLWGVFGNGLGAVWGCSGECFGVLWGDLEVLWGLFGGALRIV